MFDLCGICCGHFQMPFYQFFGGTFLGKACVKVQMQTVFFITLFRQEFRESALGFAETWLPSSLYNLAMEGVAKGLNKFQKNDGSETAESESLLKQAWNWLILIIITFFAISCIEQLAQLQHAKKSKQKVS